MAEVAVPPSWFVCCRAAAKQFLLRRWQTVTTTGKTNRGNGWRCGESHHRAKISDRDVKLMRELHEDGLMVSEIARKFECKRSTVSDIVHYRHRVTPAHGENIVFE
jgi:DNA invertase Pin-like site-specific DNA recombinase